METNFKTKFGILTGVTAYDLNPDKSLRDCVVSKYNEIKTSYGSLVPQYEDNGIRRKNIHSVSFFNNGAVRYISLQDQVLINTAIGLVSVEYLTFYEDMKLRRIFPLNGKLSGYWSEEDEYDLAKDIEFSFVFGKFACKAIGIQFYKSGCVKSITLWPKEKVDINTPVGLVSIRIGLALYESGKIKSLEPRLPIRVNTPIGFLTAYDVNANGINGDENSLCFTEMGELESLITSSDSIELRDNEGSTIVYEPGFTTNMLGEDDQELVPLKLEFTGNKVRFNGAEEYDIDIYSFQIKKFTSKAKACCSSCASCSGCS